MNLTILFPFSVCVKVFDEISMWGKEGLFLVKFCLSPDNGKPRAVYYGCMELEFLLNSAKYPNLGFWFCKFLIFINSVC